MNKTTNRVNAVIVGVLFIVAAVTSIAGLVLIAAHDWTFILGPNFMLGVNTLMYSYLLYKSKLVPRFIATLGLTAATLILVATASAIASEPAKTEIHSLTPAHVK